MKTYLLTLSDSEDDEDVNDISRDVLEALSESDIEAESLVPFPASPATTPPTLNQIGPSVS